MWATEHEPAAMSSITDACGPPRRDGERRRPRCHRPRGRWQDAEVPLSNILVQLLAETSPHAGHADIPREDLDGAVGTDAESMAVQRHDLHCIADRSRSGADE